jgi:hypothetical protein
VKTEIIGNSYNIDGLTVPQTCVNVFSVVTTILIRLSRGSCFFSVPFHCCFSTSPMVLTISMNLSVHMCS